MRVILYVLGVHKEKLLGNFRIIGYSDSYAELTSYNGRPLKKSELFADDYDYVLIMSERKNSLYIKTDLKRFVPERKLVIFDVLYNAQYL